MQKPEPNRKDLNYMIFLQIISFQGFNIQCHYFYGYRIKGN